MDRVWLSRHLPHLTLVKIADRRDRLIERAKNAFRSASPELYLKVRDRVRGVGREN